MGWDDPSVMADLEQQKAEAAAVAKTMTEHILNPAPVVAE